MTALDADRWPARRGAGRPFVVGHRGGGEPKPENTLSALTAGIESGVDAVELDVVALAGGELVVSHDEGLVPLSLAAARALRPGLPLLDEALAWLAASAPGIGVHADVKCLGREQEIVAALARHHLLDRSLVSSNHAACLRRFAAAAPSLPRALGYPRDHYGASRRPWLAAGVDVALVGLRGALPVRIGGLLRASSATVAALERRVVSAAVVRSCHALDVPVHAWTVNDPAEARRFAALGVDAIISDSPRLLLATLPA